MPRMFARQTIQRIVGASALVVAGAVGVPALTTWADGADGRVGYAVSSEAAFTAFAESTFVPVSSFRAYDSREIPTGKVSPTGGAGNPAPVYALADRSDPTNQLIPDEATAVTYTVTVVQAEGTGFIEVDGYGFADGSTSVVAWDDTSPNRMANSGVSTLTEFADTPGTMGIFIGGDEDVAAHVIIDITGYYIAVTT